ncbi:hypothetical protein GN956_G8906 [Arapaima gigas]
MDTTDGELTPVTVVMYVRHNEKAHLIWIWWHSLSSLYMQQVGKPGGSWLVRVGPSQHRVLFGLPVEQLKNKPNTLWPGSSFMDQVI